MVDAALGQLDHRTGRILVRGEHVGRAELARQSAFLGDGIDRDDTPGAGDLGGVDCGETDSAATDHRHAFTRADVGRMEHRPGAGRHRAAKDRGPVERHIAVDAHTGMLVDQHLFGIG